MKNFLKTLDKSKQMSYNMQVASDNKGFGSIAQLGEHLPYKQGVIGSSPIVSTKWPGSSVG